MKRSDAFTGSYLKQDDVPHPIVAAVGKVVMETLGQGADAETKPILHFTDSHVKPMVLNFGNWGTIESAYGEDSDMWTGKPVEVYVDPNVMFGTKKVGGLRIRIPSSNGTGSHQSVMNLNMALTALKTVGIEKEALKRVLASKGFTDGFKPSRDTQTVLDMIKEAQENAESLDMDNADPF